MGQYEVITSIGFVDIRIVTKEVYDGSTRNWTNRAGSFLEQSRAFFDSYLGRWDRNSQTAINDEDIEDSIPENGEECTSGATSGEEIWGTPTSGENDEIQMFNSDQTVSSERKYNYVSSRKKGFLILFGFLHRTRRSNVFKQKHVIQIFCFLFPFYSHLQSLHRR